MDFNDLFAINGTEGGRKLRWITGSIGAVVGGGLGALWGYYEQGSVGWAVLDGLIGAVVGGGFAAIFSAYVLLFLLAVIAFVIAVAWTILKEGG